MFPGLALALLLAVPPVSGEARARLDARAELDACAERIEELKARREAGGSASTSRELERLLVRAQELAVELQRARDDLPPVLAVPSPEELRERADAARDEADRLSAEIAELDVKIGDARRPAQADGDPAVAQAVLGTGRTSGPVPERVRALQLRRAALAELRVRAEQAAASYEAEARAAEDDH